MRTLIMAGVVLCASGAIANAADEAALNALRAQIGMSRNDVAAIRKQAIERFRRADVDDIRGVSQADFDQQARMYEAQHRASFLAMTLTRDLDGDGRVTRSELRLSFLQQAREPLRSRNETVDPTEEQVQTILEKLVTTALQADADKNGVLTFEEIYAHAATTQQKPAAMRSQTANASVPLSLDANGDGIVSLAEYEAALDIVLREIDVDGDGKISPAEHEAYRPTQNAARQAQNERRRKMERQVQLAELAKTCRFPEVPSGALVAVVGTHEGAALSNLAMGDGSPVIRIAHIDIQEGERPIYVIARASTGIVWQFTGAVGRVAHVIALANGTGETPYAGVVGIDRARVSFRLSNICMPGFTEAGQSEEIKEGLAALLHGARPDVVVALNSLSRARLPIGMASGNYPIGVLPLAPSDRGGRAIYDELLRSAPLGIAEIDPKSVVASLPARSLDVQPGHAGLLQLVEKRSLEITEYVPALRLGRNLVIGDPKGINIVGGGPGLATELARGFRVLGPMTLPTGLEHSMRFVVPSGVPVPFGNPAPAKVTCESGAPLPKAGEPCR